jgi:hypothetical protein
MQSKQHIILVIAIPSLILFGTMFAFALFGR